MLQAVDLKSSLPLPAWLPPVSYTHLPYQENADAMFNSALLFELAIMKDYAIPMLRNVPNNKPEYSEAYRLRKFLEYFASVQYKELPPTSLLREFLGGSSFRY